MGYELCGGSKDWEREGIQPVSDEIGKGMDTLTCKGCAEWMGWVKYDGNERESGGCKSGLSLDAKPVSQVSKRSRRATLIMAGGHLSDCPMQEPGFELEGINSIWLHCTLSGQRGGRDVTWCDARL